MQKPKIVFFGSGPVAAKSLKHLLSDFEVVAVVTKPKPSHHKGAFPVVDFAESTSLPLFTVANKSELSELISTKSFHTDTAILIDFGIIVSKDVIDYFPRGIINSHFSLLPQWRGADPITFSILSGQSKTGVSLMLIDEGMDTGKLIGQKSLHLDQTETTPILTDKLIGLSAEILPVYLNKYLSGKIKPRNQPHPDRTTYSRKLKKSDGILDFTKRAEVLEREVRAYLEWPKSSTQLAGIDVIITSAEVSDYALEIGKVIVKDKQLIIGTSDKSLRILKLKPAGKTEMTVVSFLAGYGKKL